MESKGMDWQERRGADRTRLDWTVKEWIGRNGLVRRVSESRGTFWKAEERQDWSGRDRIGLDGSGTAGVDRHR